jgi:cob(I)alamin adenosyltransferase
MRRFPATLIAGIIFIAGNAFAENPVDAALDKYQADLAKLEADLASDKDKATIDADKEKLKADKSALKAARRAANLRNGYHQP